MRSTSRQLASPVALVLLCSTVVAFVYAGWDINSWKFSYVGDEWAFYVTAREIAAGRLAVNPFDMQGVYGFNGMLGSVYQAAFLKLLGANNVAWRLSNIVLIVPISLFFALWLRDSFGARVALLGTLLLQASCYLANYLKIGYVNSQAFALFVVALYLAARYARRPTALNAALLGGMLGVSFYIYLGPLFPVFVAPSLLPLLRMRRERAALVRSGLVGLAIYVGSIAPGIASIADWGTATTKTSWGAEGHLGLGLATNALADFALFYHNFDYLDNHFIAGPYLDLFTGLLAGAGILLALVRARAAMYRTLLLSYALVAVVIGITSPYDYTPATRGIFLIPFGAAFAGIGLAALAEWLEAAQPAYVLLLVIWGVNVYQSQVGVFQQAGYSATALVMRSLQDAQHDAGRAGEAQVVLVESRAFPYDAGYAHEMLAPMQQAYGLTNVQLVTLDPADLTCGELIGARVDYFSADDPAAVALGALSCGAGGDTTITPLDPAYLL